MKYLISSMAFLIILLSSPLQADQMDDVIRVYRSNPNQKALAISTFNGYTWRAYDYATLSSAKSEAKLKCEARGGRTCLIYFENDKQVRKLKKRFSLPTKIVVFDSVSKKTQRLQGKTTLENFYANDTSFRIVTDSGKTLCTGRRTLSNSGRRIGFDGNCFGVQYSGSAVARKPFKNRMKHKGSWIDFEVDW